MIRFGQVLFGFRTAAVFGGSNQNGLIFFESGKPGYHPEHLWEHIRSKRFMLRNEILNTCAARARRLAASKQRSLLVLCSLILASSGTWLITSCAQSRKTDEQTRQRRTQAENTNAPPAANTNTGNSNNQMNNRDEEKRTKNGPVGFYTALEGALRERGTNLDCDRNDPVGRRILEDYGAIFVAASTVKPPPACIFKSEAE